MMSVRTILVIGAMMGISAGSLLDRPTRNVKTSASPKVRREPASGLHHRPGNYLGQSPEAAKTAIAAAEAKRARRIARNKRLAGEVA